MELVITIDLESKAMTEARELELSRMFSNIIERLRQGKTKGIIFDRDHCDQGEWEITESFEDMKPRK